MRVYADNAATTYMSKTAIDALMRGINEFNGNPNSLHTHGQITA
ncbi:MAG: cysteine desulfurase NifS, partial [Clostridiales bacterium]|nr:cysteine desulfurase NifS [Clostridiales bacterium]